MEKIAIIGSREFNNYEILDKIINSLFNIEEIEFIISGGARGADTLAETFAYKNKIQIQIFNAKWNTYGKSAGMIRNKEIVENSTCIVAFWDGKSKGTLHSIELAKKQNKKGYIYDFVRGDLSKF